MSPLLRSLVVIALALAAITLPGAALAAPPGNDDFANATVIDPSSLPYSASVDNTEATTEPGEPLQCVSPPPDKTVWYSFTPTANAVLRADTAGSNFNSFLEVFQSNGSGFGGLSGLQCQFFGNPLIFSANAGTTYYFQAAAFPFSGGGNLQFHLQEIPPPPNDDFAAAAVVSSLPYSNIVDTTGADTRRLSRCRRAASETCRPAASGTASPPRSADLSPHGPRAASRPSWRRTRGTPSAV